MFYPGNAPTPTTNPQDGTLSVTVSMSVVLTNSGKPTADMVGLERDNGGHRYVLIVIDVFSKYALSVPVKPKDGKSVRDAFKSVLRSPKVVRTSDPRKFERLQTDKGKEFFNREFTSLMTQNGIHHVASVSDQKAALVEWFNWTLKNRIWTYLSAKRTKKLIDALLTILTSYNKSCQYIIRISPNNVTKDDKDRIWVRL